MTTPTRDRWRTILLLLGIVPALAAVAFTVLVMRFLVLQHVGDKAYDDGRYLDAAGHYRSAGHLNPFEDWLAAFDAGAARHTAGRFGAAIKAYRAALDLGVPHREECTVRIDLALAFEAVGDRDSRARRLDAGDDSYRSGISALEDGHCPTDSGRGAHQTKDAATVDERLHQKLNRNQQARQQQKKKDEQQHKKQQHGKGKAQQRRQQQQQREQKLRQQNQQGLQQRKDQQSHDEGFGYQPNW